MSLDVDDNDSFSGSEGNQDGLVTSYSSNSDNFLSTNTYNDPTDNFVSSIRISVVKEEIMLFVSFFFLRDFIQNIS